MASVADALSMITTSPPHAHFLLLVSVGWVNRQQQQAIDYLLEENRVLREQLGGRRLRLTDDQRRRLAVKGRLLGRKILIMSATAGRPAWCLRALARPDLGRRDRVWKPFPGATNRFSALDCR